MGHEGDGNTNYNWCTWCSQQGICKRTRGLGNKRISGENPNYSIDEIGQNTEKSPKETCYHSNSRERLSANVDVKKSQGIK